MLQLQADIPYKVSYSIKMAKVNNIPIETSQKAQWLEPGKQIIKFTFDNSNQLADDSSLFRLFTLD